MVNQYCIREIALPLRGSSENITVLYEELRRGNYYNFALKLSSQLPVVPRNRGPLHNYFSGASRPNYTSSSDGKRGLDIFLHHEFSEK